MESQTEQNFFKLNITYKDK